MAQGRKKTFRIATLGCRTNQYESQAYRDQLIALGYESAQADEEADLCIVNTCTVTSSSDFQSRHEIRSLIKKNPRSKVVVTGCLAENKPHFVRAIEGVHAIVPNQNKESLVAALFPEEEVPEFAINRFESHTRAFVKVQDGCNSFCSYCIIPYVRGRSRSRKIVDIIDEVKGLIKSGYKEVVLTGINIGDFEDAGKRLAALVREVDAVPGLERLRLSSIDPDEVDDELQETLYSCKTTCPSLHLVLQAGSNLTLKRMNRKYTRQIFLETARRLRAQNPDFTFTTDIIVGFPGESEQDFEETLSVMEEIRFAKVHMFPYSPRERTKAFSFQGRIKPDVLNERKARVLRLAEQFTYKLQESFLHRIMPILTENVDSDHPEYIVGHTANFLRVKIARGDFQPNQIVNVTLSQNTPEGLQGIAV